MAVPSVQILSSATVRASWKSENRQIHRFLSYTFIRTPARYFRHGSRFSTVRTCLHSPEKASDGKYLGATRARALKSNYTHCVEVAESRVISNNTITRNNRVYQTRPAYTSSSITFISSHCVLVGPGPIYGEIDTLDGSEWRVTGNLSDFHERHAVCLFEM